ncbi:MAG TPA: hypothetical protein VNA13_02125 [Xanthomonadales bacterium]|nr:hypothetical protein [Xanthomonadales bacterium]
MNTEIAGGQPVEPNRLQKEKNWENLPFNRYFRERFKRGIKEVDLPGLGRSVRMIDVLPQGQPTDDAIKVVVPGWTESVKILKPVIRAWVKRGEHVISYTPGKLLNPTRKDYPVVISNAIQRLEDLHGGEEMGRAALADQKKHEYFPIHVQKALELLAVMNTYPSKDKKLHAHSQGLPIATIAALLQPDNIDSIIGDSGAGTIGKDKVSRLVVRFGTHLSDSTLRAFKGPKDAWRTILGGYGAVKYVARNRTKALREAGVIATSDVYPALDYLHERYGINSALIIPTKDRLFPQDRVISARDLHAEETGYSVGTHSIKGGHNETYVRAERQVASVSNVWKQLGKKQPL